MICPAGAGAEGRSESEPIPEQHLQGIATFWGKLRSCSPEHRADEIQSTADNQSRNARITMTAVNLTNIEPSSTVHASGSTAVRIGISGGNVRSGGIRNQIASQRRFSQAILGRPRQADAPPGPFPFHHRLAVGNLSQAGGWIHPRFQLRSCHRRSGDRHPLCSEIRSRRGARWDL
jgi:hypothetical protein